MSPSDVHDTVVSLEIARARHIRTALLAYFAIARQLDNAAQLVEQELGEDRILLQTSLGVIAMPGEVRCVAELPTGGRCRLQVFEEPEWGWDDHGLVGHFDGDERLLFAQRCCAHCATPDVPAAVPFDWIVVVSPGATT
jgi:hypothetical protein